LGRTGEDEGEGVAEAIRKEFEDGDTRTKRGRKPLVSGNGGTVSGEIQEGTSGGKAPDSLHVRPDRKGPNLDAEHGADGVTYRGGGIGLYFSLNF
jgi:hypothetical protein